MVDGSYVGLTQWQAAIEQPLHLVAIAPHYNSSDCHQGWTYQSGAFDLWFAMSWTSKTLAPDTRQRRFEAAGAPKDQPDFVTFVLASADFRGFRRESPMNPGRPGWPGAV